MASSAGNHASHLPTLAPQVKALNIPASENFDFALFLADPKNVRDWNIQGLPSDSFSTENGVMVTRGTRWPLMVDPQGQVRWAQRARVELCTVTSYAAHETFRTKWFATWGRHTLQLFILKCSSHL